MITIKYTIELLSLLLLSYSPIVAQEEAPLEEVYFQEVFQGADIELRKQVETLTRFSKVDFSSEHAEGLTKTLYSEKAEGEAYYEEVFRANDIALDEQLATLTSFVGMTSSGQVTEDGLDTEEENSYHQGLFERADVALEEQVNELTSFNKPQSQINFSGQERTEREYKTLFRENDMAVDAQLENFLSFTKMSHTQHPVKRTLSEDLEELEVYHQAVFGKTEMNLEKQVAQFTAFTLEDY